MKKVFLIIFFIIFSLITISPLGYAVDDLPIGEEISLYLNEVKIIPAFSPIRIAIGNPEILDVAEVTKREITLSPKAVGTTTLVFWDSFGEQSYQVHIFPEDMNKLKRRVDVILGRLSLPEVYSQAQDSEGKVFILGKVKTPQEREKISVALGELKDKTVDLIEVREEEKIIEIEVQILELNKDATNTLGFTWPGSVTFTDSSGPTTAAVTGIKRVFHVSDFTRSAFNVTLDALAQEGKARVLSRPRLACQSGKEAELLVGGEKPIMTTSVTDSGGEGTEVDYKEYGIKLKIKPTVMDEKRIKLALNIEVSEVGTVETLGSATETTARAYPLTKRAVSTELALDDGQILAIGGLIKEKEEADIRKTPFLGDLPLVGALFRKKQTKLGGGTGERGDTELFITLTPTIIKDKVEEVAEEGEIEKPEEKIEKPKEIKKKLEKKEEVSTLPLMSEELLSEEEIPEPLEAYSGLIQRRILENLIYPKEAKEAGLQGIVKLGLHLSYLGELSEVVVRATSGYKTLDDNAILSAQKVDSYPPFPPTIKEEEIWIDVPIVYQLD